MTPGYCMLSMEGLDLTDSTAQDIANSHLRTGIAKTTGKPVYIYGVEGYGPIPAVVSDGSSNAYVLTFLTYTATVATTDKVTVVDLLDT